MTTMLRNLIIKEVSLVDEGANPDADITLKKNKEEGAPSMTWLEKIGKAIADALGIANPEDIEKAASTFGEQRAKTRVRRVFDNVWWDYQYALRESLESIISDNELDDTQKSEEVKKTLAEFVNALTKALTDAETQIAIENTLMKSGKKISADRLNRMIAARDKLDEIIKEAEGPAVDPEAGDDDDDPDNPTIDTVEGEEEDMKIDKSKLTPAERAILEDLEKRYGTGEATPAPSADPTPAPAADPVTKSNEPASMHPEVQAELDAIKKMRESMELEKMTAVAKKYEVIGKKADELAPKLVEMQKSGAYDDFIAILDEQVAMVEKSGLFSEVGKRGSQGGNADSMTQLDQYASEIMKSNPTITLAKARDLAYQQHPELIEE